MKMNLKKLLSLLLVLAMFLGMAPAVLAADEVVEVAAEDAFFNAVAGTSGTVNVKLTGDFGLTRDTSADTKSDMIKAGRTVVLDLNGHTISSSKANTSYIRNAGTLTIKDTAGGGKISVSATGTLTIESGLFEITTEKRHAYAIWSTGGTVTINGGTFTATQTSNSSTTMSAYAIGMQDAANVTINSGTFTATNYSSHGSSRVAPLYVETGAPQITIKGGSFEGVRKEHDVIVSAVRTNGSPSVTIEGGIFTMSGSKQQMFEMVSTVELMISDGTFTSGGTMYNVPPKGDHRRHFPQR